MLYSTKNKLVEKEWYESTKQFWYISKLSNLGVLVVKAVLIATGCNTLIQYGNYSWQLSWQFDWQVKTGLFSQTELIKFLKLTMFNFVYLYISTCYSCTLMKVCFSRKSPILSHVLQKKVES